MKRGTSSTICRTRNLRRVLIGATVAAACAATASAQTFVYSAELSGQEVVPPVTTTGMGTAWFIVDVEANSITYDLTFDQLAGNEVDAHIDGFAPSGATGSMVFDLGLGKHKSGVWSYAQADEANILDGLAYVKIDSDLFPSGELRGQIEQVLSPYAFVSSLAGSNQAPPVTTSATGTGVFWLDPTSDEFTYQITYADLSSTETEAHLHGYAPAGQNAPVIFDLGTGFHKTGSWLYQPTDEAGIVAGDVYVNVHSSNFTGGEIRGQVELEATDPGTYCTAKVNSQLCVPAIDSAGLPTLSGPDDFEIGASQLINQSVAVLFWSPVPDSAPFMNGTMCLSSGGMTMLEVVATGGNTGTIDCSGLASVDFTQLDMSTVNLVAGDRIYTQWWYRDTAQADGTGFGATDALAIVILP